MNAKKNKKIFAERLKQARSEAGYSQYKLADIMQCARTTISAYELGRNEPSYSDLIKLSEVFNVSAEWLMGNSDAPSPQDKKILPGKIDETAAAEIFARMRTGNPNRAIVMKYKGDKQYIIEMTDEEFEQMNTILEIMREKKKRDEENNG